MTKLRAEPSVSSLPDGSLFYQAVLNYHTSTNLTAQNIHTLGVTEVHRIQQILIEVSSKTLIDHI